jgi:hypothetical protein
MQTLNANKLGWKVTCGVLSVAISLVASARAEAQIITPPTPVVDVTNPAFQPYQDEACNSNAGGAVHTARLVMDFTVVGKTVEHVFIPAAGFAALSQQVRFYQDAGTHLKGVATLVEKDGKEVTLPVLFAPIPDGMRLVVEYVTARLEKKAFCFTISGYLFGLPKPVELSLVEK